MVSNPHGFIIHWIKIFENHEKVTKVVDIENWRIDNSQVLRWVVSLIERNSPVSSTKSSIHSGGDSGGNEGVATSGCWHGEDDEDDEDHGGVVV
ncbi:hypothetical protein Tco_0978764 [Tanacetum coccineum]|uniref:Uncharacterized protein n=1 Tax=Tanacetum coccineum TaxID=301880 RepID=A0ABQ5EP14_9ASTR